ncbi:MAG TPA: tetratricopeptide repeat protein [Pyrinomonadaceae bacterium]|jgi:tetratricopeptide (TPR) repeat protein|nr:tetratricopeptide repeat protein [Pyrinomonadaceae bacterium]
MICAFGLANAQTSQNDEATRLSAQVVKLFKEKKYKEALPVAEKVVKLREQEFGANHFKTGEALLNLGFIESANGDKGEAEKTLERAIAIYQQKSDLDKDSQVKLAQMLDIVAFYKYGNRKVEKAKELYQKSLEIFEKNYGQDALETVSSLWALGNIYQFQKDYKNAEKTYRRVYEIRAKKLERSDWNIQEAQSHYYCMSVRNDNGDEALNVIKSFDTNKPDANQDQTNLNPKLIKGGVINGKAINLAKPAYPLEARSARAGGAVNVQATIDEQGKVIFACAISGNKLLFEASEYAAYQSMFSPAIIAGKPVKVMGVIVYNFVP